MKEFWNNRYAREEYIYGTLPNEYLKQKLAPLPTGKILLPAEGERRNAVYAATQDWQVFAFDQSIRGKEKADRLARQHEVNIDYKVAEMKDVEYQEQNFDVLALIYAHFDPDIRSLYHRQLTRFLKIGGYLILEGFSKDHSRNQEKNPFAGGPKNIGMLYDPEEIKSDFPDIRFEEAFSQKVILQEGAHHRGEADVVRFFGKKN